MGFDPQIRAKIRQLAQDKKNKLTAKDVFLSHEFHQYLTRLAYSMGKGAGETTTIVIEDGGANGPVAYTNGTRMYLNAGSSYLDYWDTMDGKFLGMMGNFFHEKAHDLFNDFNEEKKAMEYIQSGVFYGADPENMSPDQIKDWADMKDALKAPHTRQIFNRLFHEINNCMADRHDEESIVDAYGSFVGESIYLGRQAVHAGFTFFETDEDDVKSGRQDELTFLMNNILQLCLFDDILTRRQSDVEKSEYWKVLEKIQNHTRIACATDDVTRRFAEINWILLYFWPYIRKKVQQMKGNQQPQQGQSGQGQGQGQGNQGNGQSGNQQGQNQSQGQSQSQNQSGNQQNQNGGQNGGQQQQQNGSGSQTATSSISAAEVQQILDAIANGAKNGSVRPVPDGHHSSDIAITRRADERDGKVPDKNRGNAEAAAQAMAQKGKDAIYQALNSIANEIAQHQAEDELEEEAKNEILSAVQAVNAASSHKGIPIKVERVLNVNSADMRKYEQIMSNLKPVSRRMQKQLLDALRDLRDGYVQKHKQYGRMIIASDAYRPDQKYFANKKLPQDLPDMAVSVLIDHSGSMSGRRIENAMKAAVLLLDFCAGVNIPVAIAGHNAVMGGGVNYYVYADYEQISNKDKYRASKMAAALTKMTADHCNRDGAALNVAARMLEKRNEEVKLLFIISDGQPNHNNYGGEEAAKDLQSIVKRCKQRGIEVIACAIGDDKENIAAIYGDGFLDISDLNRLPKTLVNIVKKRILASAF